MIFLGDRRPPVAHEPQQLRKAVDFVRISPHAIVHLHAKLATQHRVIAQPQILGESLFHAGSTSLTICSGSHFTSTSGAVSTRKSVEVKWRSEEHTSELQ